MIAEVIDSAVTTSRMMRVPARLPSTEPDDDADGDLLVGNCPAMQEVYRSIGRVANQDVTVLVLGESGTGKEVIARAIYNYSPRADERFLAINCAAIPEQLLESELFGHEKGLLHRPPTASGSASSSSAPPARCFSTRSAI